MQQVIITLLSGLAGVILGSITQFIYSKYFEKRRMISENIKMICENLLLFIDHTRDLLEKPKGFNNILFNLSFTEKSNLLSYLRPLLNKKQNKKLDKIIKDIDKQKELISLNKDHEEALNVGKKDSNKDKFLLELGSIVNNIHEQLIDLQ